VKASHARGPRWPGAPPVAAGSRPVAGVCQVTLQGGRLGQSSNRSPYRFKSGGDWLGLGLARHPGRPAEDLPHRGRVGQRDELSGRRRIQPHQAGVNRTVPSSLTASQCCNCASEACVGRRAARGPRRSHTRRAASPSPPGYGRHADHTLTLEAELQVVEDEQHIA